MIHVVDAHSPPDPELPPVTSLAPPIVAVITDTDRPPSPYWLGLASFTLTESPTDDPRCVRVDSIDDSLAVIESGCTRMPITAATTADVFRVVNTDGDVRPALVTESLAYSTLQSGPEFAQWMAERGPTRIATDPEEPVVYERDGDALRILFNRPYRHNAFTDAMRIRLLEALTVAQLDTSITDVEIRGAGRSFCSGGDLAESAPSRIRQRLTSPGHDTVRHSRSTPSAGASAPAAAPSCTARSSAAAWRWRPTADA